MRVERYGNTGFACVREFLRSGQAEVLATLASPDERACDDYACPAESQTVRLARHVAPPEKCTC